LLGLARRRRRTGELGSLRSDQLRQGSARPARPRQPRRCTGAVPKRPGRRGALVTRALEVAERAVAAAEGDGVEAVVQAERSGFARFAGSEVHQPTLIENVSVFLRVVRGQRAGAAAGNRLDDEGIRELAARAGAAADASPEDPRLAGVAGPSQLPEVEGHDEETAALSPAEQARLAADAI